jgi:hypothetical protein
VAILVALHTFVQFLPHNKVAIWCENTVAVNIFTFGGGNDPILQAIDQEYVVTGGTRL